MFPELYILDFIIPMYPLCVATGFLVGTAVLYWDFCKLEIKDKCAFPIMCFAEAGGYNWRKVFISYNKYSKTTKVFI